MERLTTEEIVETCKDFRDDCEMGNADLFARMIVAEEYKIGKQWPHDVKAYRESNNKFCLTIPLVKPTIKQVVGSQIQNPKDVTIVPECGSGSDTGARVRTRQVKHAMDSEHAVFETTQWFEAGLTSGVGFIGAFIDRHEDPLHGNLVIERLNEFECGLDPNCSAYDINSYTHGAKYFIWEPWVDKNLVEEQYPKHRQELVSAGGGMSITYKSGFLSWLIGSLRDAAASITGHQSSAADSTSKYKYKVTHTWWRRPKTCVVLYVEGEPEYDALTLVKDKDIRDAKKMAKQHPDKLTVKDVVVNVMCHTIRVGDLLLDHIEDELNGVMKYPIGVYSPYFDNGYRAGMVEDMIGTQDEINWGHSQNLQIIKHLSTYHWLIGKDTDGTFMEWLEANADQDNLIIDESRGDGKVEKEQSKPYLSGLDRFVEIAKENLKLITNVRTEDPAFDSKNMSGKAIALKQINSQTGQAAIFQNFDYSLNIFGQLIDEIIVANEIYSPDEIRAIVEDDDLIDATLMSEARTQVMSILEQGGIEMPQLQMMQPAVEGQSSPEAGFFDRLNAAIDQIARPFAEEMLLEEIHNLRKGRYTTKVALSPYATTMRMAEYGEGMELNKALIESGHPPLSRKRLISLSDIKDKEEILQEDEAMQHQMMQMAAQEKGAA